MKPSLAALILASTALMACSPATGEQAEGAAAPETAEAAAAPTDTAVATAPAGEPAFAAVYPDAALSAPVIRADGETGPGGMATFTTPAAPDAVIGFYRQRAEAAGLVSTSAMSQGEARGYKAAAREGGASVEVIAAPDGDATAVQLTWSAGR